MVLDSLAGVMTAGLGAVAAVFAGLWARQKYRTMKDHLEMARRDQAALDAAMTRLEAARKTPTEPLDAQTRTHFERQK